MTDQNKTAPKPKAPPPDTTSQIRRFRNGYTKSVVIAKDHNPFKQKRK